MVPRLVITSIPKERIGYINKAAKDLSVSPFNIFNIAAEDGSISIDKMREISSLFLTQSSEIKLIVIDSIDLATIEAQNSLLKILEEKTGRALFLLFANQPESVIPTIRSRSTVVYPQGKALQVKESAETAKLVESVTLSTGPTFLNEQVHILKTREDVFERIDNYISHYQKILVNDPSQKNVDILKKLIQTRKEIQFGNVNPQFAYDILLIFISKVASMK